MLLNIDVTFICLKQNEIAPSRFAQSLQRKERKRLKLNRNKTLIVSKYGEAKIIKEYLKGEVANFEDFK